MQLKLRVGVGDTLTIDVQPSDTFQDLSDRLFNMSGLRVDLSQLRSKDKPFEMTTNVIQYFAPKIETERKRLPKLCRLCSRVINSDPHYIFDRHVGPTAADKINACLPLHVTTRDLLPKQICTVCFKGLNLNFEFMKKVMAAQKSLESVFSIKANRQPKGECCPLCVSGKFCNLANKNGVVSGGSLKEDGGEEDSTAKEQVASPVNQVSHTVNQPPTGSIALQHTESPSKEYYLEDEVVTGFWDGGVQGQGASPTIVVSPRQAETFVGSQLAKKYRKRTRQDDEDSEWTIDEEYLPVSRRGRPKGTRNKNKVANVAVEKSCALCGWLGPELEMLNHSLSQHCQPDLGYFPCPQCKANHSSEQLLENHLASLSCLDHPV